GEFESRAHGDAGEPDGPHQGGLRVRATRPPGAQPAMRLRVHAPRQPHLPRRAAPEAGTRPPRRARSLALLAPELDARDEPKQRRATSGSPPNDSHRERVRRRTRLSRQRERKQSAASTEDYVLTPVEHEGNRTSADAAD